MISLSLLDETRRLGECQGYEGLSVRDVVERCSVNGFVPAMETEWMPSPEERAAIAAGGRIRLVLQGTGHPPVMLFALYPTDPYLDACGGPFE